MKRKLSKEGRKNIVAAINRRWAKYRAEKNGSPQEVTDVPKRRKRRKNTKLTKQAMSKATRLIAQLVRMLPDDQMVKLIKKL